MIRRRRLCGMRWKRCGVSNRSEGKEEKEIEEEERRWLELDESCSFRGR